MKRIFYFLLILIFNATLIPKVAGQSIENLVPLTSNPNQMADANKLSNLRTASSFPLDTIVLSSNGLRDNFSYDSHRPDTSLWDLAFTNPPSQVEPSGVYINRTWAIAPVNLGVCTFDGIKWNGQPYVELASVNSTGPADDLVSRPIDLTSYTVADSVYLSFWYESQGRGYAPNTQDSFLLDFNIPAWNPDQFTTVWKTVWYVLGYTPTINDTNFHLGLIKLDSAVYFTSGFRFRFHNYASQCGSNDHWHLDEVFLKDDRNFNDTLSLDVGFVYPPTSGLTDFWSVPHTHYKASMMASNFNVQIRNNDITARNITYWYYVFDESNNLLAPTPYPNLTGAVDICPTYFSAGYMNSAPLTHPPINYSYDQTIVNADSTTYVMKHVLKENATTFDTCATIQKFYNYYAYDDGSAEVGYGLYGQYSQLAYKFTMPLGMTDTLKAIQMYFLPVQDITNLQQRTFSLTVWSDQGNEPGTILYSQDTQSPEFNFETPNRFVSYGIDSGTVVLSGGQTYYIGWVQQAIDRLYVGFDYNTDHHDKIYYNTSGNWNQSIFSGSLMIRPVFADQYDASGVVEQRPTTSISIFPNPAHDLVYISGLENLAAKFTVSVFDIAGRIVLPTQNISENASIDISSLKSGIYLFKIIDQDGIEIGVQRLAVAN